VTESVAALVGVLEGLELLVRAALCEEIPDELFVPPPPPPPPPLGEGGEEEERKAVEEREGVPRELPEAGPPPTEVAEGLREVTGEGERERVPVEHVDIDLLLELVRVVQGDTLGLRVGLREAEGERVTELATLVLTVLVLEEERLEIRVLVGEPRPERERELVADGEREEESVADALKVARTLKDALTLEVRLKEWEPERLTEGEVKEVGEDFELELIVEEGNPERLTEGDVEGVRERDFVTLVLLVLLGDPDAVTVALSLFDVFELSVTVDTKVDERLNREADGEPDCLGERVEEAHPLDDFENTANAVLVEDTLRDLESEVVTLEELDSL